MHAKRIKINDKGEEIKRAICNSACKYVFADDEGPSFSLQIKGSAVLVFRHSQKALIYIKDEKHRL